MSTQEMIGASLFVASTRGETETVRQLLRQHGPAAGPEIVEFADEVG